MYRRTNRYVLGGITSQADVDALLSADTYKNLINPETYSDAGDYLSSIFTGKDPVVEKQKRKEQKEQEKQAEIQRSYEEDQRIENNPALKKAREDSAYRSLNYGGWFDLSGYTEIYNKANASKKARLESLAEAYQARVNDSVPIDEVRRIATEFKNKIGGLRRGGVVDDGGEYFVDPNRGFFSFRSGGFVR
jgi:hypothetical protein